MGLEAYDVTVVGGIDDTDLSNTLHGRRQIFTGVKNITRDNVIDVLQKALSVHHLNRREEIFLKKYDRGIQPILERTKQYNAEINNKIVVNYANAIHTFKTAEFAGEPIQYVSRRGNNGVDDSNRKIPDKVAKINDMMLAEGKQTDDFNLAYQMFVCGVAYRLVFHDEKNVGEYLDEAPFEIAVPDVENTFVVRYNDAQKKVVMGVTYVYRDPPENAVEYTVYTPDVTYTIEGLPYTTGTDSGLKITKEVRHNFGMVTLIEYPCNTDYIGAAEVVIQLLNAMSLTLSNQLDGLEQFIQALMVFDGVDISREDFLELKDLGAIKLPASQAGQGGGGKKLYYLNEQLDQSQTNSLLHSMEQIVLKIVGMPSQGDASSGDSSNNGAVIMKNGWWHAESRALQTQTMWKKAETDFLKVVLKICNDTNTLTGLKISDLEPRFWRQSYEDLLVKTQSFSTLRTAGMPAIQAFKFSHLSRDPESDAIIYDDYQQMLADELDRLNGVGMETDDVPLKEDDTTNPNTPEGIQAQAEGDGGKKGGDAKGSYAICPVCGKRFIKKESNQVYDSIACANRGRRSTPRYGL